MKINLCVSFLTNQGLLGGLSIPHTPFLHFWLLRFASLGCSVFMKDSNSRKRPMEDKGCMGY